MVDKELSAAKERQDIELGAQRATLQEQRNHIGILDSALTNAQQNIRRLEEELRKKQMHIDRLNQLHGAMQQSKQCERKNMLEFDPELAKESNRSGSSTNTQQTFRYQFIFLFAIVKPARKKNLLLFILAIPNGK